MVGTRESSSRLTTSSNAIRRCGCLAALVGAFGDRAEIVAGAEGAAGAGQHQDPDRGIGLDPVEQFSSASRSSGCSRFRCFGRLRRMVARAPSMFEQRRARRRQYRTWLSRCHLFSSSRRLASASMVSARSGCRAISRRKSTRSSTNSRDTRVVVILAERRLLPSSAISPKNAPSPSALSCPAGRPRPRHWR